MRKALLLILLLLLILSACSEKGSNMFYGDNNEEIADQTFTEIIAAVSTQDVTRVIELFSCSVKSQMDLSQSAAEFVTYFDGDIISFSAAVDAGVGADYRTENGQVRKDIQSAFRITTNKNSYYIAIKECIRDEFDSNNVGILSIYAIEASNWTENYVYRGDGKWTGGIHIAHVG